MKKLLLTLLALLSLSSTAVAKDPKAIVEGFTAKTKLNTSSKITSALLEMEFSMMGMEMPMKVISRGDNYRAEISVMGTDALIVGDEKVAYVTAGGQTQKITDKAQIEQLLPMTKLSSESLFRFESNAEFKYLGQETKQGKQYDIVQSENKDGVAKLYFNTLSGMLEMAKAETSVNGEEVEVDMEFNNYKKFSDGALTLPSTIITKTMGQTIKIQIVDYQLNYPTSAWMFAFPTK